MVQKSIFKSSIWKVFEVFVDEPLKNHYIKEISRKINLAPTSVRKHVSDLERAGIIIKRKGERFYAYAANRDNNDFLYYKRIFNLIKIKESGLIEYIVKSIYPISIVLYGSYSIGEDVETSDIDLLIITKTRKRLEFDTFERKLKRKIHPIFESSIKNLHKNLRSEAINGIVLHGYLT